MEYQKVGRGGVGNFYSQGDVEIALKRAASVCKTSEIDWQMGLIGPQDAEAHRKASVASAKSLENTRPHYAPTGRGGAGNWASASKVAIANKENANVTRSLQETKPPELGHSGRGGAGNYRGGEVAKKHEDELGTELEERVYRQVVEDVEKGLQAPGKAHLVKERLEFDTPR